MTLDLQGDPACWDWPLPDIYAFRDDESAEAFLRWWNRLCAICEADENLVLEHDHATGLIRGYACPRCNGLEAYATEPDDVFARYRQRNPASMLGLRIPYSSAKLPMKPSAARRRVVVLRHQPDGGAQRQMEIMGETQKQANRRIANNVRAARIAAGYSQRELGEMMAKFGKRMPQQVVTRIEAGKRQLSIGEGVAIAELFGTDLDEFFGYLPDDPAA